MKDRKRNLKIAFICFSIASVLWAVNVGISLDKPYLSEVEIILKLLTLFVTVAAAVVNFIRYRRETDAEDE